MKFCYRKFACALWNRGMEGTVSSHLKTLQNIWFHGGKGGSSLYRLLMLRFCKFLSVVFQSSYNQGSQFEGTWKVHSKTVISYETPFF